MGKSVKYLSSVQRLLSGRRKVCHRAKAVGRWATLDTSPSLSEADQPRQWHQTAIHGVWLQPALKASVMQTTKLWRLLSLLLANSVEEALKHRFSLCIPISCSGLQDFWNTAKVLACEVNHVKHCATCQCLARIYCISLVLKAWNQNHWRPMSMSQDIFKFKIFMSLKCLRKQQTTVPRRKFLRSNDCQRLNVFTNLVRKM